MFLAQKDQDLGLTLTLGGGGGGGGSSSSKPTTSNTPFNLNMMMLGSSSSSSSPTPFGFLHKLPWNTSTDPDRTFVRGIDVNRSAGTVDEEEEEEAGMSSPNSTVSTVSGGNKRSGVEIDQSATTVGPSDDIELERTSSRGMSDEEDGSDNSRKKLRLTKDQSAILEDSFKEHNTLNPKQKLALARRLGLRPRQVEVWFQNRRARTKLKQTEVDCEFLKRCCEQLTEENRRLQKEVAELRALKLSPQFYMQMTPPTTLTVCTSCERAAAPPTPPGQSGSEYRPGPAHHRGVNPWVATTPVPIRPL